MNDTTATTTATTTDDEAARKAVAIIAAHVQHAIPSPLWAENQRLKAAVAELRAELAAATARAEAAEAKLAIVEEYAEYYYYARADHEHGGPTPWPFFDEWLQAGGYMSPQGDIQLLD